MSDSKTDVSPRPWWRLSRASCRALAIAFCMATALYASAWMFDARHPSISRVEIGINQQTDTFFDPDTSSVPILNVMPESPAAQAGLRAGDQIVALNGHNLTSYALLGKIWSHSLAGDPVDIAVRRPGESLPLTVHAVFRPASFGRSSEGVARTSAREVMGLYPIFSCLWGSPCFFSGRRIQTPGLWHCFLRASLLYQALTICRRRHKGCAHSLRCTGASFWG
jgi:hypothetical protein